MFLVLDVARLIVNSSIDLRRLTMRSQAHRSRFISLALLLAVASVFLFAPTTVATIIGGFVTGGGGTFIKLEVPFTDSDPDNTVGDNTFQNPNLYGFDEDQNILLVEDVIVDIGTSPIVIGEMVASHYIMFDPEFTTLITGTVDFDSEVIAIITSTGLLLASDFLANTGVTYLNPALRGLEGGSDSVSPAFC